MGDPAGIGAEVIVKALVDLRLRRQARFVIYGMNEMLAYAADLAEIDVYWHRLQHDAERAEFALIHDVVVLDYDELTFLGGVGPDRSKATREGGRASLAFLDGAIAAAKLPVAEGGIEAVVTAPICKESWQMTNCRFPGHTEMLQQRTRSKRSVMLFESPVLRVSLATVHVPLMEVKNILTIGTVFDAIDAGYEHCKSLGIPEPRIGVCGLNPHAGEGGLFGDEDARIIAPAVENAKNHGIQASGPYPADTIFIPHRRDEFDLIVAMYHDQGLIPVKMIAFESAVNVTCGLPIIRTSPDHGTAFDIAGRNLADPSSMKAAIELAIQLSLAKSG